MSVRKKGVKLEFEFKFELKIEKLKKKVNFNWIWKLEIKKTWNLKNLKRWDSETI